MTQEILFEPLPENLEPADRGIDIFCAPLDPGPARLEELAQTLSTDERERAGRFYFQRDRDQFVARRGILREILGRLLRLPPGELAFSYGPRGKPYLAGLSHRPLLHFNMAHSGPLAVYAVSCEHEVGIDVERFRPLPELNILVEQCCSPAEIGLWRSLSEDEQIEFFIQCWTRKEAFLKANGEGISEALNQIEPSFAPNEAPQLVRLPGNSVSSSRCLFDSFVPALGYVGTLAVKRDSPSLTSLPALRRWGIDHQGWGMPARCMAVAPHTAG
jgi:4'-phosphopantetheinyl transferase